MKQYLVLLCMLVVDVSALYTPSDDVVELNPSNFNRLVMGGDELWIIEFYAPWCGHCQSLAPEYKKAATALKGIVKVGAVDMDQHQSVGQPYNVKGFPTIKLFGSNKNSPTDYNGQRTAQGIVDVAMSTVRSMASDRLAGRSKTSSGGSGGGSRGGGGGGSSGGDPKDVIELTDSNFESMVMNSEDMWLVEFFAPWCGHCKSLAPHWQQAASDLKGKVKLGAVDATVHQGIAQRYGVRGYPTIKMFPAGKKDEAVEFDGGRTASDIVAWALDRFSENIPAPEVTQMNDQSDLTAACDEHQLCIVAILPHILDCQADCRSSYISVMQQLADKYKKRNWGWVWAEGGAQLNVEEAFGIGGFGYPAMAALNARKMKFALMRGSFGESGINEFLRELAVGRGSTAPLKNASLPTVVKTDPWDGKDGELPVEEEIDLSDVELDDLDMDKKDEL